MTEKTIDVTAMGELLIDFAECGSSGQGNSLFEACPGGAPCNVLSMLAKLGKRTAFMGKVGDDLFGRLLRRTIAGIGIDHRGLVSDPGVSTTLAFVKNDERGERSFSFVRNPGADMMFRADELREELLKSCRVFHFGTLSMTHPGVREATKQAVARAKAAGALISFDPNLRPLLWRDLEEARAQIAWGCGQCDVVKISEEEVVFLTGAQTPEEGARQMRRDYPNIRLLLVTYGPGGSEAYYGDLQVRRPTFLGVPTVDTTGAGDTFCGCCLGYLLDHGLEGLSPEELGEMLSFANAGASLVTTRKGAIRSMPTVEEIRALLGAGA